MSSLNAFKKLEPQVRKAIIGRILSRKRDFLALTKNGVKNPAALRSGTHRCTSILRCTMQAFQKKRLLG